VPVAAQLLAAVISASGFGLLRHFESIFHFDA
jgi:hypothetical protein